MYMDKGDLHQILKRYLRGEASPEEKRFIDRWYHNMGKNKEPFFSATAHKRLENRYWSAIKEYMKGSVGDRSRRLWHWYGSGVAAAVLFTVIAFLTLGSEPPAVDAVNDPENRSLVVFKRIVNRGDSADQIILPDGTKVILEPKTRIQYAPAFDGPERKVYLDGKAFFDVVRDEQRPFKVCTQKVITKVLGTSFAVTAYRHEKEVTVSVRTGKVSVYTREDEEDRRPASEIILTPNQEFIYYKDAEKGKRSIVDEPQALVPPEEVKRLRFEDASPKLIFEAIEKVYGVDIVFDEAKFSHCRVTTSISDGNIFNRINIICEVMNATYRLEENKIVIEGDGCQSSL